MSPLIKHALVLHLYQPPNNLEQLLQDDEEELRRILLCYERIARHAHNYADVARLHVVFSVPLLEQLRNPEFIDSCRHIADIPAILDAFRSAPNIEFIGSGCQHAPLPLTPREDWDEQLRGEREIIEEVLGRVPKGYWPPEDVFSMEMVPALTAVGYEYVLLGNSALKTEDDQPVDPYHTYQLSHQGDSITVVPWDAGFSQAQEHGLDAPWLADEVRNGVAQSPALDCPYLLTTCSDGENGEWFRQLDEAQGFFGHFFSPYMEFCETGEFPIRPANLTRYIHSYPATHAVYLRNDIALERSTWNYPAEQKAALDQLFRVSEHYWSQVKTGGKTSPGISHEALAQARRLMLQATGSCYLLGQGKQFENMIELLEQAEILLATNKQAQTAALPKSNAKAVGNSKKQSTVSAANNSAAVGNQAINGKNTGDKNAVARKKSTKKRSVAAKKVTSQTQAEDELSRPDPNPSPETSSAATTVNADKKDARPAGKKTTTTPSRKKPRKRK